MTELEEERGAVSSHGSLVQGKEEGLRFSHFVFLNWDQCSLRRKTLVTLKGRWFLLCPDLLTPLTFQKWESSYPE